MGENLARDPECLEARSALAKKFIRNAGIEDIFHQVKGWAVSKETAGLKGKGCAKGFCKQVVFGLCQGGKKCGIFPGKGGDPKADSGENAFPVKGAAVAQFRKPPEAAVAQFKRYVSHVVDSLELIPSSAVLEKLIQQQELIKQQKLLKQQAKENEKKENEKKENEKKASSRE